MSTWPEGGEVAEAYTETGVVKNGFVMLPEETPRKYDELLDRLNV